MIRALTNHHNTRTKDVTDAAMKTESCAEIVARSRFQRSFFLPLRKISCSLCDGVLMLRGSVPTYYLKQLAQTIAISTEGVREVINELHVDFPERS